MAQKVTYAPGTRAKFDVKALERIGEKKNGRFIIPDFSSRMLEVYLLVFPQWDAIEKIDGWPSCSVGLWKTIANAICDKTQRENQMLYWMNRGFSADSDNSLGLKDDEISLGGVVLYMKEKEEKTDGAHH